MSSANIIKIKSEKTDKGKHVAQKPLHLMELLISLVTIEGQAILDPFAGSGTVCVAAKNLNRKYIGIDIDPQCVAMANRRLKSPCKDSFF